MFALIRNLVCLKKRARRLPTALRVECLEDRCVPALIHVGPTRPITTIQGGINAAIAGDTVLVDPGTYTEQLTIAKSITLEGSGAASTFIKAPANLASPNSIVEVKGALAVTIENFTVEGPGSPTGNLVYGIRVDNGGSARITNNHITNIRDNPLSGVQSSIAIDVGRNSGADVTTGSATITNNVIDAYQKGGILVDNTGSSAVISGNTITGAGPTAVITQNGIQISRGANASVQGNTVSGNRFLGANLATGIFLFNAGAVSVAGNTLTSNDVGLSDSGGSGDVITSNQVNHNIHLGIVLRITTNARVVGNTTEFNGSNTPQDAGIFLNAVTSSFIANNQSEFNQGDGILADNLSSGNTLFQNTLKFNALFDAQDLSAGKGTSGTADIWIENLGNTSSPTGLVVSARTFDARPRWGAFALQVRLLDLRILSLQNPKPAGIP